METVLNHLAEYFDFPILEWIAHNLQYPFLDSVMPLITQLGDAGIVWILVAAVLLFLPKHRTSGLGILFALIIGFLVCNVILKPLVARPRPYDYLLTHFGKTVTLLIEAQHDFSFPSGHTIASFEAATVLILDRKKIAIPCLFLACLIAFSRLYLYVHYPTDVLASILLGSAIALLGSRLAQMAGNFIHAQKESS